MPTRPQYAASTFSSPLSPTRREHLSPDSRIHFFVPPINVDKLLSKILAEQLIFLLDTDNTYEAQRDQTYNLNQVPFASEWIKDAQQTMTATKAANKELEGMTKTSMQDGMMDLMDVSNEIQDTLGRSAVPQMTSMRRNLWGWQPARNHSNLNSVVEFDPANSPAYISFRADALKADMDFESNSVPSYLKPDRETDL